MLEETITIGAAVTRITYTLGDDVISESTGGVVDYLIYDGHGSVRHRAAANLNGDLNEETYDPTGQNVKYNTEQYDAYGNSLIPQATDGLGYAGEMWDVDAQHSYNRARWYNPSNGRFNRVDPFAGNNADPQSLHKYTYAHNNPVNGSDPSGMFFTAIGTVVTSAIQFGIRQLNNVAVFGANLYMRGVVMFAAIGMMLKSSFVRILQPLFRMVGSMNNIRFSRPGQTLRFMDRFLRFFRAQTQSHPRVSETPIGSLLQRFFTNVRWQQHHVGIQQSWSRIGSPNQWYPNDALANAGMRALGNSGFNLLSIPSGLNNALGRSAMGTFSFATATYGTVLGGIAYIYRRITGGLEYDDENMAE